MHGFLSVLLDLSILKGMETVDSLIHIRESGCS